MILYTVNQSLEILKLEKLQDLHIAATWFTASINAVYTLIHNHK